MLLRRFSRLAPRLALPRVRCEAAHRRSFALLGASAAAAAACLLSHEASESEAKEAILRSASGSPVKHQSATIWEDYDVGDQLGCGNFATVHRGRCKRTNAEVAIKVVPKNKQTAASIRHEVDVLTRVSMHKRIASLEGMYETDDAFYIVMEFCGGGEVFDHLCDHGAMSEVEAAKLVSELAGAIAILHAQGMAHADIKPENLLLTKDGHAKLVDFGLSCRWADGARVDPNRRFVDGKEVTVGSLPYWAPEVFEHGPGLPNDMWGLGVLVFILLTAGHPFDDNGQADEATTKRHIINAEVNWAEWPADASKEARHLVERLLTKEPERRLTIEQLLQHPWIQAAGAMSRKETKREAKRREEEEAAERELHRKRTAKLRAACFALLVQDVATQRAALVARDPSATDRAHSQRAGKKALARHNSVSGAMLQSDMLTRTFRVFDTAGKGYISAADLQRVLHGLGQSDVDEKWMVGATDGDREGRRITYGSFVRMMAHSVKAAHPAGTYIFRAGEPVRHFFCLLNGEVQVLRTRDGVEEVMTTLKAGEYFGENALLEGARLRNSSVRCVTPCEVIKLSKADFEAGIGQAAIGNDEAGGAAAGARIGGMLRGWGGSGAEAAAGGGVSDEAAQRRKLISFIRMVSRQQHRHLDKDAAMFHAGEPATKLYILAKGRLAVHAEREGGASEVVGVVNEGEPVGEMSLLGKQPVHTKTLTCDSRECEVVEILGDDFLRLVQQSRVVRESFEQLSSRRAHVNRRDSKPP